MPLKVIEEVYLCIPQLEVNHKTIINELCLTVNELRKQIKNITNNNITEEKLEKNL